MYRKFTTTVFGISYILFSHLLMADSQKSLQSLMQKEIQFSSPKAIHKLSSSPNGQSFLKKLFASESLMEEFLCAGHPVDSVDSSLLRLYELYKLRPSSLSNNTSRKMAVAAAYQLPFNNDESKREFFGKFDFFFNAIKIKQLRPSFYSLHACQMRQLLNLGSYKDLQYMQDNFNLPLSEYTRMHGYPGWSRQNEFGESIHGGDFRKPYYAAGMTRVESIMEQGAVCGGKSTFAVIHAMSRGIPASTVALPGHCAFILHLPGKGWTQFYGGKSGGGAKGTMLTGNTTDSLRLASKIASDYKKYKDSMSWIWASHQMKEPGKVYNALYKAIDILPLNVFAWKELVNVKKANKKSFTLQDWKNLNAKLISGLGNYPDTVCYIAKSYLVDKRCAGKESLKLMVDLIRKVNWTNDNAKGLSSFARVMCKDIKVDNPTFRKLIIEAFIDSPHFASLYSTLEDKIFDKPQQRKDLWADLANALQKNIESNAPEGSERKLFSFFMSKALKNQDKKTYHFYRKKVLPFLSGGEKNELKKVKPIQPFSGSLLSKGGLITSSQMLHAKKYGYPKYLLHAGTLEESGGFIIGKSKNKLTVNVRMGKLGKVTGVIIQAQPNKKVKGASFILSLSEDGKKWREVAQTSAVPVNWRVDLKKHNINAAFAKLERLGKDDGQKIAFQRFAIYGEARE